jgi:mono/diheme cytochrome c family protein
MLLLDPCRMYRLKLLTALLFAVFPIVACLGSGPNKYVIADSKAYESSLFRQHCSICHGPEGEGRTLDDGTVVPSLRAGEFKTKTDAEIYKQLSEGGNGMLPFRNQLTERELRLMTEFVRRDLRGQ